MNRLIAIPISIALGIPLLRAADLSSTIAAADAIVVADVIAGTYSGTQYSVTLSVQRTLQGSPTPGAALQATYVATNKATRAGVINKERGLFLLKNTASAWTIISAESGGVGLRSAYFPIAGAGPAANTGPVGDKVVRELATAAASAQDSEYALRFVSKVSASASPIVVQTLRQWVAMPVSPLHVYGLAGLIASGDAGAVQQFAAELTAISKLPNASQAGSSLNAFHANDPLAVKAIGQIATNASAPVSVQNAAVSALSNIHSKETLPFLYILLTSPNQTTRWLAIRGFSGFVANTRASAGGLDSAEALDETLNPVRAQAPARSAFDTSNTRNFLHFGVFQDAQDESSSVSFWKSWFDQNRGVLGQ